MTPEEFYVHEPMSADQMEQPDDWYWVNESMAIIEKYRLQPEIEHAEI